MRTRSRFRATAAVVVAASVLAIPALAEPDDVAMFDDFVYTGSNDGRFVKHGWTVRSGGGAPGVPGANWDPSLVTFPSVDGGTVLRLEAATDGTTTAHTELSHQRKFTAGTYAARVRFSDNPSAGPDGEQLVQSFFPITPPGQDYGELDFEYLPNGGWGEPSSAMFETTWATDRDNVHDVRSGSLDGWHVLVIQVADGRVRYFVDGQLTADHGGRYYPEAPMSLCFNLWFIADGLTGSAEPRTYQEQVDWVLYVRDQALSPEQVRAKVDGYRAVGADHVDTVT